MRRDDDHGSLSHHTLKSNRLKVSEASCWRSAREFKGRPDLGHSQAWCHAGLNLLGKGKDPKRITHATVFVSQGSYQTLQTGVSPKHRAALIRSGERVSGHAAKQTQTKSAIRRLLENLSGVTDYEDRRQVEAARERAQGDPGTTTAAGTATAFAQPLRTAWRCLQRRHRGG